MNAAHHDMADMVAAEKEAAEAFEDFLAKQSIQTSATEMVLVSQRRWIAAQADLLRVREQARG